MSTPAPQLSSQPQAGDWPWPKPAALVGLGLVIGIGIGWLFAEKLTTSIPNPSPVAIPSQPPAESPAASPKFAAPVFVPRKQDDEPRTFDRTDVPGVFDSEESLDRWASETSFDGAWHTELTYGGHRLLIVFRSHTSGIYTSEPFVFLERSGKWQCLLHLATCPFRLEASLEGDWLVFRHTQPPQAPTPPTELFRYNLVDLESRIWPSIP